MKAVQMVDLRGQYLKIKAEIDEAIQDVIDQTAFIRGEAVSAFEAELQQFLGGGHCVGVGNGTDALQIAMMAAGIGPGDEVITTPFTFVATAEAAALLGGVPVFVDIDPATFNIDPQRVKDAVTEKTRAVIPVHLFGLPADMEALRRTCDDHDLTLIEDNAQAIGAEYRGQRTGLIGDFGCLSFFPSKNLGAFGDGGAITASDADLADRARMISNHGSRRKYHNEVIGINSRLDTIQAAILRVKLKHLDQYIEARRRAAAAYHERLIELNALVLPSCPDDRTHVFHQFTIRVRDGRHRRDALATHLSRAGIPTAIHYPIPLHKLPAFDGHGRIHGSVHEAERAADEVLSLPMHTELTDEQIDYVAEHVAAFFR